MPFCTKFNLKIKKRVVIGLIILCLTTGMIGCSRQKDTPFDKEKFDSQLGGIIEATPDEILKYISAKWEETYVIHATVKDLQEYQVDPDHILYWVIFWDDIDTYKKIGCALKNETPGITIGQDIYLRGNINISSGGYILDNAVMINESEIVSTDISLSLSEALEYSSSMTQTFFKVKGYVITEDKTDVNGYTQVWGKLYPNEEIYNQNSFNPIYIYFAENETPKNGEYIELVGKLSGSGSLPSAELDDCFIMKRGDSVRDQVE